MVWGLQHLHGGERESGYGKAEWSTNTYTLSSAYTEANTDSNFLPQVHQMLLEVKP